MTKPKQQKDIPETDQQSSGLWSVEDVATFFKCSRRSVYRMIDSGYLPKPIRLGGSGGMIRWQRDSIEQLLSA